VDAHGAGGLIWDLRHRCQTEAGPRLANVIGRYFETRGDELRFDACQAQPAACAQILLPP
jgi:TnpA family transposase